MNSQLVNVTLEGDTVATAVFDEATLTVRVVAPVRLQPFFPSPFLGFRLSVVVRGRPARNSGMTSAEASTVPSRLLEMSSARAAAPPATAKTVAADVAASPLNQDLDDNDMWNPL